MIKTKRILVIVLFAVLILPCTAQTLIHPKGSFLGFHPLDTKNRHLYENALDANAQWVVEPNVMVSVETYLRGTQLSWRFMPGFYVDAAAQPALFFHAGIKYRFLQIFRSSFDIAVGPTYNFRQDWHKYYNYVEEGNFNLNGNWENKFYVLGELEYKFFLTEHWDITASILYGHEWETFTFTFGIRYWLTTVIKHPINCSSCPFDDLPGERGRR
ncbi:MAG: hypothetical protein ACOCVX_01570 [Bacteroidales bacterium]|jgi:hypothetical protein